MPWTGSAIGSDRARPREHRWDRSGVGCGILVPGYPHWSWRQRERALALFGSYLVSVGVGVFAWGTPVALVLLAFAYATHVFSVADAVRQGTFPGFGRWVPAISASGALGLAIYVPALGLATLLAWPGIEDGPPWVGGGYLVDCRSYRSRPPQAGEWVWLRGATWGTGRLGRVVAGEGQDVEWSDEQVRVDGRRALPTGEPAVRSRHFSGELAFTVPPDHLLIAPASTGSAAAIPPAPRLVPRGQILGRAWARLYPIRDRQLLHATR